MRREYSDLIEEVACLLEQGEVPQQELDPHVAKTLNRMSRLAQHQTKSAEVAGTNSARKLAAHTHAVVADAAAAQGVDDLAQFHDTEVEKQHRKIKLAKLTKKAKSNAPQPDTANGPIKQ